MNTSFQNKELCFLVLYILGPYKMNIMNILICFDTQSASIDRWYFLNLFIHVNLRASIILLICGIPRLPWLIFLTSAHSIALSIPHKLINHSLKIVYVCVWRIRQHSPQMDKSGQNQWLQNRHSTKWRKKSFQPCYEQHLKYAFKVSFATIF